MTAPANNVMFGWPIYSDGGVSQTPTLSGGSWSASLPLTNLQNRYLDPGNVARSTDAASANTTFDIDLKITRSVRCIAILVRNITKSSTPTIQAKLSTVSNFASTTYDSTAVQYWPTGLTAEGAEGLNVWRYLIVPSGTTASRYVRIALVDTGNADGYLDVCRVVVTDGWQPDDNMELGATLGWESSTDAQETDASSFIYNARTRRRVFQIRLPAEAESEAMTYPWRMQRILGSSGQFFFVWDPTDTTYNFERSCLAVFRELTPMDFAFFGRLNTPLTIREEL